MSKTHPIIVNNIHIFTNSMSKQSDYCDSQIIALRQTFCIVSFSNKKLSNTKSFDKSETKSMIISFIVDSY